MIKHGFLIFCTLSLAACARETTSSLQSAAEYTEGLSAIPPGKFLFVEYWDT